MFSVYLSTRVQPDGHRSKLLEFVMGDVTGPQAYVRAVTSLVFRGVSPGCKHINWPATDDHTLQMKRVNNLALSSGQSQCKFMLAESRR